MKIICSRCEIMPDGVLGERKGLCSAFQNNVSPAAVPFCLSCNQPESTRQRTLIKNTDL